MYVHGFTSAVDVPAREQDDPLWLGSFCAAGLSAVTFVVFHLQTHGPPLESSWDLLYFLPLMAVGMARRVRREGGNVTQRVQEAFSRQAAGRRRKYTRGFAVYLLLAYAFAVVVAVATYGLTAGAWLFIVGQGTVTALVVSRTSWGLGSETDLPLPDGEPDHG